MAGEEWSRTVAVVVVADARDLVALRLIVQLLGRCGTVSAAGWMPFGRPFFEGNWSLLSVRTYRGPSATGSTKTETL